MQLLTQEYELKNNREQFLYQKEQDALSQSNWEKEYAYQQQRDQVSDSQWQQTFDYQKQRDAVSDNQWLQEFNLSKKKASSSGSSKKSSNNINLNDATSKTQYTAKEVLANAKIMQGTNKDGTGVTTVKDGISGKTFSNMEELLKYYNV